LVDLFDFKVAGVPSDLYNITLVGVKNSQEIEFELQTSERISFDPLTVESTVKPSVTILTNDTL
jgi:hypothetical protein